MRMTVGGQRQHLCFAPSAPIDRVVSGPISGDANNYLGCNGIFVASGSLFAACGGTLHRSEISTFGEVGQAAVAVSGLGVNNVDWTGTIIATGTPSKATPRVNAALGKPATQSSTYGSLEASRAVDGNRDGNYAIAGSITHTAEGVNAWWEVDLGTSQPVSGVRMWNRTDCCQDRLSNFWVYLSDTPFTSSSPSLTRAQPGVTWVRYNGIMPRSLEVPFATSARYVRIQAPGGESASGRYLSLAEVEIYN
jgi:F5/8 type C domain